MSREFHDLANIFPLLDGREFDAFVEDIRENGVRDPITIMDGKILDGRNRYLAAKKAGVPCPEIRFANGDPASFVISQNLHRRHLTTSQRAMAAARLANIQNGSNQYKKVGPPTYGPSLSESDASKIFNVGGSSLTRAKKILRSGRENDIAAVEAGDMTVNAGHDAIVKNKRTDGRGRERFLRVVTLLAQSIQTAVDTKIPALSHGDLLQILTDLRESKKMLSELIKTITEDVS